MANRRHPITADNLTDAQLHALYFEAQHYVTSEDLIIREIAFDMLLNASNAMRRCLSTSDGNGTWDRWRTRCAEILNTRNALQDATCEGVRLFGHHTRAPLDDQCLRCGARHVALYTVQP